MNTLNEMNEKIDDQFRDMNEGCDCIFFVDEWIDDTAVSLNYHVYLDGYVRENSVFYRELFTKVCDFLFDNFEITKIYSPFGDVVQK